MSSNAHYVTIIARHYNIRSHALNRMANDFYLILSNDKSTTNFLISNYVLTNNENTECLKYGSAMNLYLRIIGVR
jgi:hypothetical protein